MHAQALISALLALSLATPPQPLQGRGAPAPKPTPPQLPKQKPVPKQEPAKTPEAEQEVPAANTGADAEAVLEAELAAERARLEVEYFTTCDYNGDGWISYREGQSALLLTRTSFAQYDNDGDGRITAEEFGQRYRELLDRTGAFRRPTPEGVSPLEPKAPDAPLGSPENPVDLAALIAGAAAPTASTPETFVGQYDENVDGRLNEAELESSSTALGFAGMTGASMLATLDTDGSGFAEPGELAAALATLGLMTAAGTAPALPKAKSIEELFGGGEQRDSYAGSTPRPPYIKGPVRPFRRLDIDDSGKIEILDLDRLSVSAHPRIRPAALIANLDLDGDGALSAEELAAALDG